MVFGRQSSNWVSIRRTALLHFLRVALVLVSVFALSSCSNEDDSQGGGTAITPQPIPFDPNGGGFPGGPNGPFGPRPHHPAQCPANLLGRYSNVDPNANPLDRSLTFFVNYRGELTLSWSPTPRRDRSADLIVNGLAQVYRGGVAQWRSRAICENGSIIMVTNSQRWDAPVQEWVLSVVRWAGPNQISIDINVNGTPAGKMQYIRRSENPSRGRDGMPTLPPDDEDLSEDEFEEIDEPRRPPRRERERERERQPEIRQPRPNPPRVIVPPRKEVPPKRNQPPRVTPPKRDEPKRENPPRRTPPRQNSDVDPSGCPYLSGEFKITGDAERMSLASITFRRNASGVLILGGQNGGQKLPDILLDGQTRDYATSEASGGNVTGLCVDGKIVVKRKLPDKSELRLDIDSNTRNVVTIRSTKGSEMKTFRYAKSGN